MGYKINKGFIWVRGPNIPAEYQEVEWIGMSGDNNSGSHINTNLFPYNNYQVETKIETLSTETEKCIFGGFVNGSSSTAYTYNYYNLINYLNQFYRGINNSDGHGGSFPSTVGVQYEIIYNNSSNRVIVNGSDIGDCTGTVGFPGSELCINVRGKSGQYYWGKYKYFYFKVYDKTAGKYIRDFIPCYRKSDNVIGMYDMVEGKFYTNAGTGTFTKGNDVSPTYVFKEKQFYPGGGEPSIDWILFDETDYKNSVPSKNGKFHYVGWGSDSYWTNIGYDTTNGRIYSTSSHSLGATNINANSELVNAKKIKFICDYLYCYNYNTYLSGVNFPPFTMQMNYNFSASLWDQTTSDPAIGSVVTNSTPYSAEFYYDLDLDSGTLLIKNLNTQAETELAIAGFKYTWDANLPGGNFGFSIWKDQGYSSYMGDVHLYYSLT